MAATKTAKMQEMAKRAAAKFDELRLTAGVSRSMTAWGRYEGACDALRWLGYTVTIEGGKHRVEPC